MIFPAGIVAEPQELAVLIGHLTRDADLVVVEIGDVLLAAFGVIKALRQQFVAVLVRIIAAATDQRQDAFKSKVGFTLQKFQTMYRIDRPVATHRALKGREVINRVG